MAYQKRKTSESYDKLSYRLEAMKTIDPHFDMGNGINVLELEELVDQLQRSLYKYNATLMDADDQRSVIEDLEKKAQDAAERLLAITLARYGRDSTEYRRVGGTQKSQIDPTGTRPLTFEPLPENGASGGSGSGGSS